MRRPAHLRPRSANPIASAMTPMIDVVFLLLVFFLCTATFETPEEDLAASLLVDSSRPGAAAPELDDVTLVGRRSGDATVWTVNGGVEAPAGPRLAGLLGELAAIDRALPVTIDSAEDVPMGDVVAAYDAARAAGFGRVQLAASADSLDDSRGAAEGSP